MAALLETKVRLAETVRDQVAGHFMWPFTSHANPGRNFGENGEQLFDGIRELDRIGPVNNKGLFTIWGEPTDAYHMYRANYAPPATQPVVYIVSHTWPDRWVEPGRKSGIIVYSNCDAVELFNDLGTRSLGVGTRGVTGTHFQWDDVEIATNVLHAEGRIAGRVVATDTTLLHHLPAAPEYTKHNADEPAITPLTGERTYLYRVNCGGADYVDAKGHAWLADRELAGPAANGAWGCTSWAQRFPHLPPALGSQRKISDPIAGTRDDALFQTFRYGREELRYVFTVPEGAYDVELFFVEPWYVAGGGANCAGWRMFDVAVNGEKKLRDLDLWREAGRAHAIRKVVTSRAENGRLEISFPRVSASQAVISAIAISTTGPASPPRRAESGLISRLQVRDTANAGRFALRTHLDNGDTTYGDASATFCNIPWSLLEADWIQTAHASASFTGDELLRFTVNAPCDVFIAHDARITAKPRWLAAWERAGARLGISENTDPGLELFRRRFAAGDMATLGANRDAPAAGDRMYVVLALPVRPPAPPTIIRNLTTSADIGWRAIGNLQAGQAQYIDRTVVFTTIPPALTDADWIRTAHKSAGEVAAGFTAAEPIEVYVALDARATVRPAWMREWIETNLALVTSDPAASRFFLWKRRFPPGATVELGPNAVLAAGAPAAMYSVIARVVRAAATFPVQRVSDTVAQWTITVGVGDRYGLNFRYTSAAAALPVELALINPDGSVFCTRVLEFAPTGGAEQILRTRTCESINAGTYRIRLTGSPLAALQLGELEVE